jgi:sugar-phosphatase
VTSASEKMMRRRLASVGIVSPSGAVGGDTLTRGKPDPEGYLRGAALLTRPPHAAGCPVLAVASSHDVAELRQADWIVASLDQIVLSITDSATLNLRFPAIISMH